ncbi:atp-dependent helicase [Fusarium tjaetaba]|uniref:Atp-dependent helicase n=1 Tax=Fusarium tjaetaba TaxID=1567544 RepID=A0A8H5W1U6_9HYPO|nr:atp-dependent helicase [Fusarium tjaetaba]KAF5643756.1 atp-dependent helicase [Fusarium tjaetaba]
MPVANPTIGSTKDEAAEKSGSKLLSYRLNSGVVLQPPWTPFRPRIPCRPQGQRTAPEGHKLGHTVDGNVFMLIQLHMQVTVNATSLGLHIAVTRCGFPRYGENHEARIHGRDTMLNVAIARARQAEIVLMHPAMTFRARQAKRVPTDYTSKVWVDAVGDEEDAESSVSRCDCLVTSRPLEVRVASESGPWRGNSALDNGIDTCFLKMALKTPSRR